MKKSRAETRELITGYCNSLNETESYVRTRNLASLCVREHLLRSWDRGLPAVEGEIYFYSKINHESVGKAPSPTTLFHQKTIH